MVVINQRCYRSLHTQGGELVGFGWKNIIINVHAVIVNWQQDQDQIDIKRNILFYVVLKKD